MSHTRSVPVALAAAAATLMCLQLGLTPAAIAGANPAFEFYGYQQIVADPSPAIAGENTRITVIVSNLGDAAATNVVVKLSFNDWGVTFQGWQEIGTTSIASIPALGTAEVEFDYVFENRAHTCLEALIVSADEDTNPNDDRGQINMEVVNAGESFGFYVPIVNNGEDDILVEVRGGCLHEQGADGEAFGRCRPIEDMLVVPAGGEVPVLVEVEFFPDTPRGAPVVVEVNAFDVLDPGNTNAQNHVRLTVVYNTPRGMMEDCVAALESLPALPSRGKGKKSNGLSNKIDEIVSHIEKALAPYAWVDDARLRQNRRAVNAVHGQSAVAVQQLLTLVDSKTLPIQWKTELEACIRTLTDASRILVETAIQDAAGNIGAELLLLEGDAMRLAGQEKRAVRNYHRGHVTVLK